MMAYKHPLTNIQLIPIPDPVVILEPILMLMLMHPDPEDPDDGNGS
jgi:hypothetical protein